MNRTIIALILLVFANAAFADYIVAGDITGDNCSRLLRKVCTTEIVVAFKKDGQFYKMPERFATVSNFSNDVCTIQTSGNIWTPLDALVKFKKIPDFYKKNQSGQFVKISPSYLSFRCIKTAD